MTHTPEQAKNKREIVQIAVTSEGPNTYSVVVALCNDGTLWNMSLEYGGWAQLTNIPQPDA